MNFEHRYAAPGIDAAWWTEQWRPVPRCTINGCAFAMVRLAETTELVVLRLRKHDDEADFVVKTEAHTLKYVLVGRPETVEAGLLLMELLAEPGK